MNIDDTPSSASISKRSHSPLDKKEPLHIYKGKTNIEGKNDNQLNNTDAADLSQKLKDVPVFLIKTYEMITCCDDQLASWSDDGESFRVKKPDEFSKVVIPQYFEHNKFSSFARQLNFYGFKKMQTKPIRNADFDKNTSKHVTFHNALFKRGRPDLMKQIHRSTRKGNDNSAFQDQQREIDQLKDTVDRLFKVVETMSQQNSTMRKELKCVEDSMNLQNDEFKEDMKNLLSGISHLIPSSNLYMESNSNDKGDSNATQPSLDKQTLPKIFPSFSNSNMNDDSNDKHDAQPAQLGFERSIQLDEYANMKDNSSDEGEVRRTQPSFVRQKRRNEFYRDDNNNNNNKVQPAQPSFGKQKQVDVCLKMNSNSNNKDEVRPAQSSFDRQQIIDRYLNMNGNSSNKGEVHIHQLNLDKHKTNNAYSNMIANSTDKVDSYSNMHVTNNDKGEVQLTQPNFGREKRRVTYSSMEVEVPPIETSFEKQKEIDAYSNTIEINNDKKIQPTQTSIGRQKVLDLYPNMNDNSNTKVQVHPTQPGFVTQEQLDSYSNMKGDSTYKVEVQPTQLDFEKLMQLNEYTNMKGNSNNKGKILSAPPNFDRQKVNDGYSNMIDNSNNIQPIQTSLHRQENNDTARLANLPPAKDKHYYWGNTKKRHHNEISSMSLIEKISVDFKHVPSDEASDEISATSERYPFQKVLQESVI